MNDPRSGGWVRLLIAGLVLLGPALALGATIEVYPEDKSGIGGALATARSGDTVLVGCGLYYEQSLYIPDGVALVGVGDPYCVQILTSGMFPVFQLEDVGATTRIYNLTVSVNTGGMAPVARGAGAYLENASPLFMNVIFRTLEADYGGAVYCGEGSNPTFQDCWFEGNYARAAGGAVACTEGSMPVFERCLFADNKAEATGGHINTGYGAAASLTDCTLAGGDGATGSGLASWDSSQMVLVRSIIVDGLNGRGWDGDAASVPIPDCTDIFNNAGGDWVGAIYPYALTNGNLYDDPKFCGTQSNNPYTLLNTSPCALAPCGPVGAFSIDCNFVSGVGDGAGVPLVSRLHANYPNPFNPRTTIKYELNKTGSVELAVFDVGGRLVKRLVNRTVAAGIHETVWEGRDAVGRQASTGVYFFRLKTDDTIETKRMTLVK